jgi:hypothetical protein
MSDFDTVLERLLAEPSFAQALAADPAGALAGYRLTPEEVGLLSSQVSADPGGQRAVETRANKSSVFGLLSPLVGLAGSTGVADHFGLGGGVVVGHAAARGVAAAGQFAGTGGTGPIGASLDGALGGADGFGAAGAAASGGAAGAAASGGAAGEAASGGAGGVTDPGGVPGHAGFGAREEPPGHAGFGAAPQPDGFLPPPDGYHTRVDVDGDGDWDRHMLVGRRDGGVDILVDTDRDGRADFVGHDVDSDGLVDSAEYDKNHDGGYEKTMYDDDGDGWLDRTVKH